MVDSDLYSLICPADQAGWSSYAARLFVPSSPGSRARTVETADTSEENLYWLRAAYPDARIIGANERQILAQLERRFGGELAVMAVEGLAHSNPELSARSVLSRGQAVSLSLFAIALIRARTRIG
jgi:hypothetical protein